MKITEIRKLKMEDLNIKAKELSDEISKLYFDILGNKSNASAKLTQLRRELARVKTVITEKLILEEVNKING